MKSIKELMEDRDVSRLIDWDLHPFDAVTRYLEWGTNWSRGLDHAKSCNEESVYFKINAVKKPARLVLVRQSHHDYQIISEVDALKNSSMTRAFLRVQKRGLWTYRGT